ncbi:MAG TPA: J domain-containing protein [Kofleriaceae bacterium]|nr:J domain-containing protein [Kofleriaceae bacterium]
MFAQPQGQLQIASTRERPLGKKQQRFNSLVRKIERLRAELRGWAELESTLADGMQEHARLVEDHRRAAVELVRLLDRQLDHAALTDRQRDKLLRIVVDTTDSMLRERGDPELAAILQHRAGRDWEREQREAEAEEAANMRDMFEFRFGFEFSGVGTDSIDELQRAVAEQMQAMADAQARADEQRRARRKPNARQAAAERRQAEERARVDKALQDVYRQLAKALHPDHERDPVERARKTALMQQVNVAYEAKDLLQLLDLQLRIEQVDQTHLDGLADERLAHFNRLLSEQIRELECEAMHAENHWRMRLELHPYASLTPAMVEEELRLDVRELSRALRRVRDDHERFEDIRTVKRWLTGRASPR